VKLWKKLKEDIVYPIWKKLKSLFSINYLVFMAYFYMLWLGGPWDFFDDSQTKYKLEGSMGYDFPIVSLISLSMWTVFFGFTLFLILSLLQGTFLLELLIAWVAAVLLIPAVVYNRDRRAGIDSKRGKKNIRLERQEEAKTAWWAALIWYRKCLSMLTDTYGKSKNLFSMLLAILKKSLKLYFFFWFCLVRAKMSQENRATLWVITLIVDGGIIAGLCAGMIMMPLWTCVILAGFLVVLPILTPLSFLKADNTISNAIKFFSSKALKPEDKYEKELKNKYKDIIYLSCNVTIHQIFFKKSEKKA